MAIISPPDDGRIRFFAWPALVLLGGCASPGPPRPPSLNLPQIVATPTAQREGDQVHLRWTTAAKTTDGLDVRGPMEAAVCRRVLPSPEQTCAVVLRVPVTEGASEASDRLPSVLTGEPTAVVGYRVEILNERGRSAGASNEAYAPAGPAPPPLQRLQGRAAEQGAVLTWQAADRDEPVELHRVTAAAAKKVERKASLRAKSDDVSEVTLRVPPGQGALDRTARMGEGYIYTAWRVRTVHVGGRALEVRSLVSAPVVLEMRDLFAPGQPSGLEGVGGDGVVDLSWRPNTEADLAGYFVLREEGGSSAELNAAPLPQPAFQDKTAAPGRAYRYTVVAVDRSGNRSPASEALPMTLRSYVP